MELLKKHYEKILLGFVLVGLTVGAASLPLMISSEREADEAKTRELIKTSPRELEKINLKPAEELIARANVSSTLDLASSNRAFNSMPWQKLQDGQLRKVIPGNTGPEAISITKLTPLHTKVSLDTISTSDSGSRYLIGVEREAAPVAANRRKKQTSASVNQKTDSFVIREVRGDPANPSELIMELTDTNERISVTRDKPFLREDGYMADLRYEPEKKTWTAVRVGAGSSGTPPLVIEGESYIVVAINKSEVVLSAKSNNKKTVVAFKSGG